MSLRYMSRIFLRAVQVMREHNSKGMMMAGIKSSPAGTMPESGSNPRTLTWVPGGRETMKKMAMNDQERRQREAEKAEIVMHLICWGPK